MSQPLVLASTSPFRKEILSKLGIPFETARPEVDETRLPGEAPEQLVARLAAAKARAVAGTHPGALIIGSDQVAVNGGEVLGKPGGLGSDGVFPHRAEPLQRRGGPGRVEVVPFDVHFRTLTDAQIDAYLRRELQVRGPRDHPVRAPRGRRPEHPHRASADTAGGDARGRRLPRPLTGYRPSPTQRLNASQLRPSRGLTRVRPPRAPRARRWRRDTLAA